MMYNKTKYVSDSYDGRCITFVIIYKSWDDEGVIPGNYR